ncbi:MAG TPA: hypothetical protein VFH50_13230 [Acidimicrobiales bacterium]|nr:hypothetical protein [Acidimicrobiales bacterium]
MLDVHFVILGAVIGTWGMFAYIRDTLRGVTQPHRVTWALWAAAPLLAFAVEIHSGVGLRSLMTFTVGFGPLLILIASFWTPTGSWKISPLDYACAVVSVAGLVIWLVTRHGTVALVASIAADALAAAPTLRKSWRWPETETAAAYITAAINAAVTLLTVSRFTTADVAFPIYILFMASMETVFIAGRVGQRLSGRPRRATATIAGTAESELRGDQHEVTG